MQLDEIEKVLDSSDNIALDDTVATDVPVEAEIEAASSTATGEESSLLDVVRDVVSESRGGGVAPPAKAENDGQEAGEQPPKEPDDEAFSDVPFHKHPRFQQLLRQRNSFKQDAESHRNVQSFLENNSLSSEEAADGLIIMGLMKHNPVEAWQRLKPTIQKLLVAAGEVLPGDLQAMVEAGQMDQGAALEVSRARAGVSSVNVQRSFEQQRMQRQQHTQASQALSGSADDWETKRRRNDPNFDAKFVPLQKEVLFLQQTEGKPNMPQGVLEQLEKAYKAVNAQFKPAAPAPQRKPAIKPVMGGKVAGNPQPANASTLDIIRANRSGG
jgi:hypothetical protein